MVNQDLGRVAVVLRGEYDPAAEYERLDCVSYQGSSYLVRKHCMGVTPAEGEYYQIAALAGSSAAADAAALVANAAAQNANDAAGRADVAAGNAQAAADAVSGDVNQIKDDLANKVPKTDYAPESKTAAMTQPVGKDSDGKLWTAPGSGSPDWELCSRSAWIKDDEESEIGFFTIPIGESVYIDEYEWIVEGYLKASSSKSRTVSLSCYLRDKTTPYVFATSQSVSGTVYCFTAKTVFENGISHTLLSFSSTWGNWLEQNISANENPVYGFTKKLTTSGNHVLRDFIMIEMSNIVEYDVCLYRRKK